MFTQMCILGLLNWVRGDSQKILESGRWNFTNLLYKENRKDELELEYSLKINLILF